MESFWLLIAVAAVAIPQSQGSYDKCDNDFEKVGCYNDMTRNRALPNELLNERDITSRHYDGHTLRWKHFKEDISKLACRCAAKTRELGYTVFGLQFFGECWGGPGSYEKHGKVVADKSQCLSGDFKECNDGNKEVCVGSQHINYVYRLKQKASHAVGEPESKCDNGECEIPDCEKKLDVAFVIDASRSIGKENFKKVQAAVKHLLDHMHISPQGTHVGITLYSSEVQIKHRLNGDQTLSHVKGIIDNNLEYDSGRTLTGEALELTATDIFGRGKGARPGVPSLVIVITDGGNTNGITKLRNVIKDYYQGKIETLALGIGKSIKEKELLIIAQGNPEHFSLVEDFDSLKEKLDAIVSRVCEKE